MALRIPANKWVTWLNLLMHFNDNWDNIFDYSHGGSVEYGAYEWLDDMEK